MSGGEEWTNQDGPAFRAAMRRAKQIDDAQTTAARRRAWAHFIPSVLVALAEDALRRWVILLAALLSVAVALTATTSGETGLAISGGAAGVIGVIAVYVVMVRWSYRRQWAVLLGIIGLQALLLVVVSQAS